MRVLGLIPARGGSKGVHRKNVRLLNGKPLLQYTAEASLASRRLTQVILSTEDLEIAETGWRCGLEVPFLRPMELAADDTPMLPVVQHALHCMETNGHVFDAVCILQPTTPLRRPEDIDGCIELLGLSNADAVATMLEVPPEYNPHWVYFKVENNLLQLSTGEASPIIRRQDLPPAYYREGSVYVTRRDVVMERNSLYGDRFVGYLLDSDHSVNIDTPKQWSQAETLIASQSNLANI